MMNTLCQTALEHLCLQPPLQEIFDLEGQHVIETHAGFIEHTNAHETTNHSVTLEETFGVLRVEFEQLTGGTTDFGEGECNTPDFALVAKAVFSGELIERK
jgi:hypothetical protein